jgi:hypothetical protein
MAVFDATKGGINATSYATVDEADEYFEFEYGAEWANIDDDDKEKLLVKATRMIDQFKCLYDKSSLTQALKFPCETAGYYDSDGNALSDGFAQAKQACIHQAHHLYRLNDTILEARDGMMQGAKSESIGPVSKSMTGHNPFIKYAPGFLGLLADFVDMDVRTYRA